jgi:hypothetical protein
VLTLKYPIAACIVRTPVHGVGVSCQTQQISMCRPALVSRHDDLMLAKRERIDVMIDAHVWMRREARIHGEWPAKLGKLPVPVPSPKPKGNRRARARRPFVSMN